MKRGGSARRRRHSGPSADSPPALSAAVVRGVRPTSCSPASLAASVIRAWGAAVATAFGVTLAGRFAVRGGGRNRNCASYAIPRAWGRPLLPPLRPTGARPRSGGAKAMSRPLPSCPSARRAGPSCGRCVASRPAQFRGGARRAHEAAIAAAPGPHARRGGARKRAMTRVAAPIPVRWGEVASGADPSARGRAVPPQHGPRPSPHSGGGAPCCRPPFRGASPLPRAGWPELPAGAPGRCRPVPEPL